MNWMWLTTEENLNMHRVTFPAQTQGRNFKGQVERKAQVMTCHYRKWSNAASHRVNPSRIKK